jgi:hypothetical protein
MKSIPAMSTRGDAHTVTVGHGTPYDVYMLIHFASRFQPVEMSTYRLKKKMLKGNCWTDTRGKAFSPDDLIREFQRERSWEAVERKHPTWRKHIHRTKDADYNCPLLMYLDEVIDGMHRIVRAFVEAVNNLRVIILEELPSMAVYRQR